MRSIDHQNNLGFKLKRETLDYLCLFKEFMTSETMQIKCNNAIFIRDVISCSAAVYFVTRKIFIYTFIRFYRGRNLLSPGQIGKIRKLDQFWSALQPRPDATPASCFELCAIITYLQYWAFVLLLVLSKLTSQSLDFICNV